MGLCRPDVRAPLLLRPHLLLHLPHPRGIMPPEVWLDKHDDMISWHGCFYSDFEVFIAGTDEKA